MNYLQLQGQYAEMVALQKANPIDSVSLKRGLLMQLVNRILLFSREFRGAFRLLVCYNVPGNSMRRDSYDYKKKLLESATAQRRQLHMYPEVSGTEVRNDSLYPWKP